MDLGDSTQYDSAMLIEKKLPECYWETAQDYKALICNSIPPMRTRPGIFQRSPIKNLME